MLESPSVGPNHDVHPLGASYRDPFIDPSLARGIRRGYLDVLDEHWARWDASIEMRDRRTPCLPMPTAKSFRKLCKAEDVLLKRFLPVDSFDVGAGSRRLWSSLLLMRERSDQPTLSPNGMTEAGCGRVMTYSLFFPKGRRSRLRMPIRFSAHVIDRVIQRARVVDLPLSRPDIHAIHASFSGALLWACAALRVLTQLGPEQREALNIALPADHGVFLARFDEEGNELVICTYVARDDFWDEEHYIVRRLDAIGDLNAAALAASVICPELFSGCADAAVMGRIVEAWRDLRWLLREKRDRPGAMTAAWEGCEAVTAVGPIL